MIKENLQLLYSAFMWTLFVMIPPRLGLTYFVALIVLLGLFLLQEALKLAPIHNLPLEDYPWIIACFVWVLYPAFKYWSIIQDDSGFVQSAWWSSYYIFLGIYYIMVIIITTIMKNKKLI